MWRMVALFIRWGLVLMKTYVVTVELQGYSGRYKEIIYVGQDEYKAFNTNVSKYDSGIELEVWENEKRKSQYHWNFRTNKWKLVAGW